MKTLSEQIAVMQAKLSGKTVERVLRHSQDAWTIYDGGIFDWVAYDYRIVPVTVNRRIPLSGPQDLPKGGALWVKVSKPANSPRVVLCFDSVGITWMEKPSQLGIAVYGEIRTDIEISSDRETWFPWFKEVEE